MSDEMIAKYCAPTLAGLKTGSLFSYDFKTRNEAVHDLRRLNNELYMKGLRVIPLGWKKNRLLIYVYRPSYLKKAFSDKQAADLLKPLGYNPENLDQSIMVLISRLNSSSQFPHEIGLFLGYPVEDVKGFMDHRQSAYTGLWQVYGDVSRAKKTFAQYDSCTKIYCQNYAHGMPIERLAVAVSE